MKFIEVKVNNDYPEIVINTDNIISVELGYYSELGIKQDDKCYIYLIDGSKYVCHKNNFKKIRDILMK
jgi:hypothetical protein